MGYRQLLGRPLAVREQFLTLPHRHFRPASDLHCDAHAAAGQHLAEDRARNIKGREPAVGVVETEPAASGLAASVQLGSIVPPVLPRGFEHECGYIFPRKGKGVIPVPVDVISVCSDYQLFETCDAQPVMRRR